MTVLENLTPEHRHGDIVVAFVPDEEVGSRGAKALDLRVFAVDFARPSTAASSGRSSMRTLTPPPRKFALPGVTAHPMLSCGCRGNPASDGHRLHEPFRFASKRRSITARRESLPTRPGDQQHRCRPPAISTLKAFTAVSSRLARWRRKSPRSILRAMWNTR